MGLCLTRLRRVRGGGRQAKPLHADFRPAAGGGFRGL